MANDSPPTNEALLTRYLAGDHLAVETIFARNCKGLKVYLTRRLGDAEAVEDALQETFCRLLQRAPRLVAHPRLEAWLFTVARNVSSDILRQAVSRPRQGSTTPAGQRLENCRDRAGSQPESVLRGRELSGLVLKALDQMNGPERRVFLLRTESVLSFREIAARVDAPLNTVLSRMHRAMKKVRRVLEAHGWKGPGESR